MAKKNELIVKNDFEVVSLYDGMTEEEIADLNDELSDLDQEKSIICKSIKIPSGTSNAFTVESEDDPDDSDPMKTIEAVIIFTHKSNAYWENAFGGDAATTAPTCAAIDAKKGIVTETGEIRDCEGCPFNEYAQDGSGKKCKNMRRLYLLLSGKPSIYLLAIPPTSIRDVNRQLTNLMTTQRVPYSRMVMKFSLKKAENRSGIAYNKVVVEKAGILPKEMWPVLAKMHAELKEQYTSFTITEDEVMPADESKIVDAPAQEGSAPVQENNPPVGPDGFVYAGDLPEEELPWT